MAKENCKEQNRGSWGASHPLMLMIPLRELKIYSCLCKANKLNPYRSIPTPPTLMTLLCEMRYLPRCVCINCTVLVFAFPLLIILILLLGVNPDRIASARLTNCLLICRGMRKHRKKLELFIDIFLGYTSANFTNLVFVRYF